MKRSIVEKNEEHFDVNDKCGDFVYDEDFVEDVEDADADADEDDPDADLEADVDDTVEDIGVDCFGENLNNKISSNDSSDDYRVFQNIDRDEEDSLVCQYMQSKDIIVMVRLLKIREQTLRYMAHKYAYLDNEDDMYSSFKSVWLKCLKKYDGGMKMRQVRDRSGNLVFEDDGSPKMVSKKTPFNTYLFTSMKNRVKNIIKKRHNKKYLDDNGDSVYDTMKSLDYELSDDGNSTLKDLIADEKSISASSTTEIADLIKYLGADKDEDVARAVDTFINNSRFETLTAACNYRVGTLKINKWDKDVLSMGKAKNGVEPSAEKLEKTNAYLKNMIESTGNFNGKFEVVNFVLHPNKVDFVAKMDDPKVLKKIREAILKCREAISE